MLGALVGDAAGATLEFCNKTITEEMALKAMTMPGGGSLRVGPGQITDDGELTLTLWTSLNSANPDNILITLIKGYAEWYESIPFDIGRTCRFAFETYSALTKNYSNQNKTTIKQCEDIIKNLNDGSEANGALMRATAIATWIAKNQETDIYTSLEIAKEDAKLSHPNIVCQEVNIIYVFAIVHLLRHINPYETLKLTDNFVSTHITSDKVKLWYFKESLDIDTLICTAQPGHLRWGFVMAMFFLRNPHISFEEVIKITLMKGGDTDTNAAIVGGLVGAYQNIPEYMLNPVLTFDCTKQKHIRPECYSVKNVIGHLINL